MKVSFVFRTEAGVRRKEEEYRDMERGKIKGTLCSYSVHYTHSKLQATPSAHSAMLLPGLCKV